MKKIFQNVLDEILRQVFSNCIHPGLLYENLTAEGVLEVRELELIEKYSSDKQHLVGFRCLKAKDEYKVFRSLQNLFHTNGYVDLLNNVHSQLIAVKKNHWIWPESPVKIEDKEDEMEEVRPFYENDDTTANNSCFHICETLERFMKTTNGRLNICTFIESLIKFAFDPHRKSNEFTEQENDLIFTLGEAAQSQCSFMNNVTIKDQTITHQHLDKAKKFGLVFTQSVETDLVFAHEIIAEYCVAKYWFQKMQLNLKEITIGPDQNVYFSLPQGANCSLSSFLSCFFCHFCKEYKEFLWNNFDNIVPMMDEYESLKVKLLGKTKLQFGNQTASQQLTIRSKHL